MILFSQYLSNVPVPCLSYRDGHLRRTPFHLFQLFPVLLTISLMWGLCAVLTVTDVLPEASQARTDNKMEIIHKADWFRFPYPCKLVVTVSTVLYNLPVSVQWGRPTVSVAGVFGILAGVLASAIESVGDYYACARLSGGYLGQPL